MRLRQSLSAAFDAVCADIITANRRNHHRFQATEELHDEPMPEIHIKKNEENESEGKEGKKTEGKAGEKKKPPKRYAQENAHM